MCSGAAEDVSSFVPAVYTFSGNIGFINLNLIDLFRRYAQKVVAQYRKISPVSGGEHSDVRKSGCEGGAPGIE